MRKRRICKCCFSLLYSDSLFAGVALVSTLLLFGWRSVSASVLINEVYYDHPGTDQGYEFVELINTGDSAVCLGGFSIEFHNGSGAGWSVIWEGEPSDTIPPGGLFVVGGGHVDPVVDDVVDLGLQNGPDALRICLDGLEEDLVGYGELADAAYFERSPALDVPAGYSLGRSPDGEDTNDNRVDFVKMDPSPGLLNLPKRDLAVRMECPDKAGSRDASEVRFAVVVQNRGTIAAGRSGYSIEIHDSTTGRLSGLAFLDGTDPIIPGDSLELEFFFTLERGYHFVACTVKYPGDDRPSNNVTQLVVRVGRPDILVTEVMAYPRDGCPQYVEIYNAGIEAVDIGGWMLRDHAYPFASMPGSAYYLEPGTYAVITGDSSALSACFPDLAAQKIIRVRDSWPYFNHRGSSPAADSIVLADSFCLPVEAVSYPPQEEATKGRSLERADLYPGGRRHVWTLSTNPSGGSPGCENMVVSSGPGEGSGLRVSPNPFDPHDGGVLLIEVPFVRDATRVVVKIFDLKGRVVREVGSTVMLPAVFLWNGDSREGTVVPSGIYVVASQIYMGGGRRVVERVVVGCGGRQQERYKH